MKNVAKLETLAMGGRLRLNALEKQPDKRLKSSN